MAAATLTALKAAQLKHATFLLGLPSIGTKSELVTVLARQADSSQARSENSQRILSVDMGIRNLAYCVVDTVPAWSKHRNAEPSTYLHISAWSKTDLLKASPGSKASAKSKNDAEPSQEVGKKTSNEAFTPSQMSKTAYQITQKLIAHKPDSILIERQRFRSGGGSAIQEWTVRVNMLESMLWACLQTLQMQKSSSGFPTIHEVNPARVANFWVPSAPVLLRPSRTLFDATPSKVTAENDGSSRKKVQKKDKINVVRSWLGCSGDVKLTFEGEAAAMADHFRSNTGRGSAKSTDIGKLDDLADCLLQAAAWARWEENRRAFVELLAKHAAG
ncbi:hypothetical protein LTR78_006272 [Recurvomyces mirabilis]|uniref:Mitochondrial resolvase Ydc2 catalytic domain-containing protein n=1 Tax=Recurvomyces mirabilis TaxID=574656 RepID=A0AAE1C091_9PEZI|nr:hypothetical protein LTR78_006272 [Recurvomyces mirabilis]KAK5152161.1 hypothetical protein LTS14_008536 [Recurvomyces mirabilis]